MPGLHALIIMRAQVNIYAHVDVWLLRLLAFERTAWHCAGRAVVQLATGADCVITSMLPSSFTDANESDP